MMINLYLVLDVGVKFASISTPLAEIEIPIRKRKCTGWNLIKSIYIKMAASTGYMLIY